MIDSHAHLTYKAYRKDLSAVLERARGAGVTAIINASFDLPSSRAGLSIAEEHEGVVEEEEFVPDAGVARTERSNGVAERRGRRAAGASMAVEDRVRFGDLDVPKRITRSKTRLGV